MNAAEAEVFEKSRQAAYAMPLEDIDASNALQFRDNMIWGCFERLPKEDPIHFCRNSLFRVLGEPTRVPSPLVKGYESMTVRINS